MALQYRVGELAQKTGVSVRTLHHYDQIGLLSPSRRTASGHRLYSEAAISTLLRVRSLVQLGFTLEEIKARLRDKDWSPERVLSLHLDKLRQQIADSQRLCQRLESLLARIRGTDGASIGEFLETIEAMTMFEKYYTKEQLQKLDERRQQLGEDAIKAVEAEWPELIAKVRAEMDHGTDPKSPTVQALARRWQELVAMFTGGDTGIRQAAATLYANEPRAREKFGLDRALFEYVGKALGA
jgi:DNA-binding transcriptional MerR regulator